VLMLGSGDRGDHPSPLVRPVASCCSRNPMSTLYSPRCLGRALVCGHTIHLELVQVRISPAHRDLDHLVQLSQGHLCGHQHPTPHRRANVFQLKLHLKDLSLRGQPARTGHEPMLPPPPKPGPT
jgi:hypothetical protein